jgi:hypothetical protein
MVLLLGVWPSYESTVYMYTVDYRSAFVNSQISLAFWCVKHVQCVARRLHLSVAGSLLGQSIQTSESGFNLVFSV